MARRKLNPEEAQVASPGTTDATVEVAPETEPTVAVDKVPPSTEEPRVERYGSFVIEHN